MMPQTRDKQLKNLTSMGTGKFFNRFTLMLIVFIILAVASVIKGVATGEFGYFMLAAIISFVVFCGWQTAPHIHNAVKGVTEGTRIHGEISISITECSDASDTYYVTVISGCSRSWRFEFIPSGWRPVEENNEAELVFISGVEWPVLILTSKGIMHPRFTPSVADGVRPGIKNDAECEVPACGLSGPTTRPLSPIACVFGILFFAVGCYGAVSSWDVYRLDSSIEKSGQRAEGHITRKSLLYAADGDSDYNVEYWFDLPSGERVEAIRGVHKKLWKTMRKGKSIVVLYSAENPNRNFPLGAGFTSVGFTVFMSAFFTLFAASGALLIVAFFRAKGREGVSGQYI